MEDATLSASKKLGRPATGQGIPIQVRLQPADLELLDAWIAANGGELSRPEAMRRILNMVVGRVGGFEIADAEAKPDLGR